MIPTVSARDPSPAGLPVRTHQALDRRLCGTPEALAEGFARVRMTTTPEMAADERGLVHGGFLFGFADHAAMLAVNHPLVVLGSGDLRFFKPVVVGETLVAEGRLQEAEGRKLPVEVVVTRAGQGGEDERETVAEGRFVCFVPESHVLDG